MKKITTIITIAIIFATIMNPITANATANGWWVSSNGGWWYENQDGTYATSEYIDGYWIGSDGWYDPAWNGSWKCNSTGWWFESGNWYPTNQWLKINHEWYYFESSGYMACNEWVGNYYIQSDGTMARDMWIGDYYVGSDGAWVPNKQKTTNTKPVEQTTEKTTETTTEQKTTEQTTEQKTTEQTTTTVDTKLAQLQNKYPNGCVEYDNNGKWVFFVSGDPNAKPVYKMDDITAKNNNRIYYEDNTDTPTHQRAISPYIKNFSRIDWVNKIVYYTDVNGKEYSFNYTSVSSTNAGYAYINDCAYCYKTVDPNNTAYYDRWMLPSAEYNTMSDIICPNHCGWGNSIPR